MTKRPMSGVCDDVVTALTNVGGSRTINISGTDYIFAFTVGWWIDVYVVLVASEGLH
jgi:hypothetical protein